MSIAFLILLTYCVFILVMLVAWNRSSRGNRVPATDTGIGATVIVPVRNDAGIIAPLLKCLQEQAHRPLEIIIVDDHSEDNLSEVVAASQISDVTLIKNEGNGKKWAITTGVKRATGSIIVTTDADCTVPRTWLKTMTDSFSDHRVSLVFGPVTIQSDRSFFSVLQSLEFASLIGSGAATAALGKPTMCNGANLAYRKTVFESVNGYEGNFDIASGDDEFLMRKLQAHGPGAVRYVGDPSALVKTLPQPGLAAFLSQRMRWASKWKRNSSAFARLLALYILVSQLAFVAGVASVAVSFTASGLSLVLLKIMLEGIFLYRVCRFLRAARSVFAFAVLQCVYPFYVAGIGLVSLFISPSWKGRRQA